MTSTVLRIDNWKSCEDKHLARTVLSFVREGKTQLQAFEHCAEKLDRSSAACGYRWNNEVRKKYEKKLRRARKEWRQKKKGLPIQEQLAEEVKEVPKAVVVEPEQNHVEWLTTGQMIDRLKAGEVAESNFNGYQIEKSPMGGIGPVEDPERNIILNYIHVNAKWRILPKFVTFEEAIQALKEGKTVTYHDDHKEQYSFDLQADWTLDEVSIYTFNDLFKSRWTIEK
jgi:RsfA family transcription factor